MIDQYENYVTATGLNVTLDNSKTLGENIADNGGNRMAYNAYRKCYVMSSETRIAILY